MPRISWSAEYRGARKHRGAPRISWSAEDARANVACRRCRPQSAHRAHRAPMRGGRVGCARVLAARLDALARVLAGRCRHVRGPSAVRPAHARALGCGGAEACSRRQQGVKRYHHTVVERGGHLPAKHESLAPYTEAQAAQQRHERAPPGHPADLGADGAQAPRVQWPGWANARFLPPSKHERCSRHAVGTVWTPAERSRTGASTLRLHRAKRSPPQVAEWGVSMEPALPPHTEGGCTRNMSVPPTVREQRSLCTVGRADVHAGLQVA